MEQVEEGTLTPVASVGVYSDALLLSAPCVRVRVVSQRTVL